MYACVHVYEVLQNLHNLQCTCMHACMCVYEVCVCVCVMSTDINRRSEIGLTKVVEHIMRVKRQHQQQQQ